ncbi:unnamed protein product [Mytilus coruscus]|uniref:TNFR-Cys domain-containing protein n=1 Tax=Mytilus coruscus TaxID=42192 RepID=A0A6J8BG87_MYTCO|nr:unnamed protein product [Mytilus coruscus]
MVDLYILAVITEYILLLTVPSFSIEVNTTLFVKSVGFSVCIKGEQYYDSDQNKCRRCPGCRKALNYLQFKIRTSQEFGALDCYPCYCNPGEKFYDEYSRKCSRCPVCNMYGYINTSKVSSTKYENLGIENAACVKIQTTVAPNLSSSTTITISNSGHSEVNSNRQGHLNVGPTATCSPLQSGSKDIEQNDEHQLESDGLLSRNQLENVIETSDERNVFVIYQKGDSCAVHINNPQSSPS